MLHAMNPRRIEFIRGSVGKMQQRKCDNQATKDIFAPNGLHGMSIVDVGCGGGILAEVCILRFAICFTARLR